MLNLLKSEVFKARKSKSVLITLILSAVLATGFALLILLLVFLMGNSTDIEKTTGGMFSSIKGSNALMGLMLDPTGWFILISVVSSITINSDFKNGIIRNQVMSGKNRYKIYTAKLIINIILSMIIILIVVAVYTVIYSTKGWGKHSFGAFSFRLMLFLLQIAAFSSLATFISMLTKSTGATIGILIGVIFLFQIFYFIASVAKNDFIADLFKFLSEVYAGNAAAYVVDYAYKWRKLLQFSASAVVTIAGFSAIGMLAFKRSDLK